VSDAAQPPVNYYQQWQEKRRREAAAESAERGQQEEQAGLEPVASPQPEDAPEFFQWTEDRERAIQECLESTVPGTLPTVHVQLQSLLQGLQHGNLAPELAGALIAEVEAYLDQKIRHEERKVPVAHQAFLEARADKLKALYAWEESCRALREFLREGEGVQLEVAAYAADQGSAFLAGARRMLLEAEPFDDDFVEDGDEPGGVADPEEAECD
jgi:hypothetical protein